MPLQICAEMAAYFRGSIMASISTCRADGPGSIPGRGDVMHGGTCKRAMQCGAARPFTKCWCAAAAETQDRTGDFQIIGLTLSQLNYGGTRTSGLIFSQTSTTPATTRRCVRSSFFFFLKSIHGLRNK